MITGPPPDWTTPVWTDGSLPEISSMKLMRSVNFWVRSYLSGTHSKSGWNGQCPQLHSKSKRKG